MQPTLTGVGGDCEIARAVAMTGLGMCRPFVFMNASVSDLAVSVSGRVSDAASTLLYRDVVVFVLCRIGVVGVVGVVGAIGFEDAPWVLKSRCAAA